MLVLSRRCDEKIVFPELGITVQVLQIRGNHVKLGIDAPDDVKVLRQELSIEWFEELPTSNHESSTCSKH